MANDDVCTVKVPFDTLLEASGERLEFKLNPAAWVEGEEAGHIAIRCRPATTYDREFLAHAKDRASSFLSSTTKKADFLGIDKGFENLMKTAGGQNAAAAMLQKRSKTGKS